MRLLLLLLACRHDTPTGETVDPYDVEACIDCHPTHVTQWQASMHAYASADPVFRAMNARGQRETGGELGSLCVRCHAPLAVAMGLTTDGLDLDLVPENLQGIPCAACHLVSEVGPLHNNGLTLAEDGVMRGGIGDPIDTSAHGSAWSPLHDRNRPEASAMCGSCHDVVLPNGVALERTYVEWQESVFSKDPGFLGCGNCHMPGRPDSTAAAVEGAPSDRTVHEHLWPGVDTALIDWPGKALLAAGIARDLDHSLHLELCVSPGAGGLTVDVTLENSGAGHRWPSGAAHDRRGWVEIVATQGGAEVAVIGRVEPDEAVDDAGDAVWQLRDFAFDAKGEKAHQFWEVASVETATLPASVTLDPTDPAYFHAQTRSWTLQGFPDALSVRVLLRPFGREVLLDLVESGDLDPSIPDLQPTHELADTRLSWEAAQGYGCFRP